MSAAPGLLVLIDTDPPSDEGDGSRGFYPARRGPPPPEQAMRQRLDACLDFARVACAGRAVLTVHTSPRYRNDFLGAPYLAYWREALATGCDLALHPHEERAEGGTFYGDAGHMRAVFEGAMAAAGQTGLRFGAFRSGTFAWGPALPGLLTEFGFGLDLSALPGTAAWPPSARPWALGPDLLEVPIGWNGRGHAHGHDTLFNERAELAMLCAVWDALRAMPEPPAAVNFLCHGFGLVDPRFRDQARRFLDYAAGSGARLLGAAEARSACRQEIEA